MKNKKDNKILMLILFLGLSISLIFIFLLVFGVFDRDKGEYDYCISWAGLGGGTLHRDNLLYTCYNLATQTFYCDYEIQDGGGLMVKPIINVTKNDEGFITEINYDEANFFNCTRWLKSRS